MKQSEKSEKAEASRQATNPQGLVEMNEWMNEWMNKYTNKWINGIIVPGNICLFSCLYVTFHSLTKNLKLAKK